MSKTAGQRLEVLRRVSSYILPAQRAIIYKSMKRSKMEYASSAWIGATPTSLAQLDSIQNRAKCVIGLPTNEYEDHRMQLLSHRRVVGATTLFYRMFYTEAPGLLCQLMPDIHDHDHRLRRSVRFHDLSVEVPRSNLVSYARSFLPSTAQLWNSLPAQIPAIRSRASFNWEVNRYLGATSSAASKMTFSSLLLMPVMLIIIIIIILRLRSRRLQDFSMHIDLGQVWRSGQPTYHPHHTPINVWCKIGRRYVDVVPVMLCRKKKSKTQKLKNNIWIKVEGLLSYWVKQYFDCFDP